MTDVVDLIKQDHREMERLFEELTQHPETRPNLRPVLTTLLTAHARAEESEVYPAAREAGGAEDVEHSQKEHLEADQLVAELAETDPRSGDFDSVLERLVEAVTHHLQEEEETVLPGMRRRMEEQELSDLADRFARVRAEHLGEQPEDITKAELVQQARNLDLEGAADRSKAELKSELQDRAER